MADTKELTAHLLQRMSEVDDPDWYEALVCAGMDQSRDLATAIEWADEQVEQTAKMAAKETDPAVHVLAIAEILSSDATPEEKEEAIDLVHGEQMARFAAPGTPFQGPSGRWFVIKEVNGKMRTVPSKDPDKEAKAPKGKKEPAKDKPAKEPKGKVEAGDPHTVVADIQDVMEHGAEPGDLERITEALGSLKQGDINTIKKSLSIRIGGKKADQAKHIAETALSQARKTVKAQPEPVKEQPKKEPAKPKKVTPKEAAKTSVTVQAAQDKVQELKDQGKTGPEAKKAVVDLLNEMNSYEHDEFRDRLGIGNVMKFEPVEDIAKRALEPEKAPEQPEQPEPEKPAEKPKAKGPQVKISKALTPRGKDAMVRAIRAIQKRKDLSDEQKQEYFDSTQRVLLAMPPAAQERMAEVHFNYSKDPDGVLEAVVDSFAEKHQAKVRDSLKNAIPTGMYSGKGDTVFLDGGRSGETADKARRLNRAVSSHEIYSHEYGHVLDGPGFTHSKSPEWQEAWKSELKGGQLTKYAADVDNEGMAEFARLLYSGEHDLQTVANQYPKCWAYFASQGWAPEIKAKEAKGEKVSMDDIFTERIVLDSDGSHADI